MSFFNSIKRVLGFGEDDIEEEIGIDATVTPRSALVHTDSTPKAAETETGGVTINSEADIQAEVAENIDEIFEHVLAVFNETLPPFLKETVDTDAQRKYLYDTLSESVKQHLEKVRNGIAERMENTRRHEMTLLRKQLHEADEQAKKNEASTDEWKRQQLSAERQKRALAERIHDLENKISELQAEREQFELENKSLVNRLRVYSVQDEDVNALREQVVELQEQLKAAETAKAENEANKGVLTEQEFEQMKIKQEMADSMINDLNRTAAELRQQLAAEQQRTASLSSELESVQSELSEANDNLSKMDEIHLQFDKLEEIIGNKNARIKELQSQNDSHAKRNELLSDEIMSLKKTIESNLVSQARSESELQKTIDELKDELARIPSHSNEDNAPDQLDMPPINDRQRRRPKKKLTPPPVKISAIDESLESTDWLVSTPPEGSPTLPGMTADSEFGYKEPIHKNPPENDAQMSLW